MASVIHRFKDSAATRWRNGRGWTRALVGEKRAAELTPGYAWQLSVAHLDAPAPFSSFLGVHRTLVPWGAGIRLEIDGQSRDVPHAHPVRFQGGAVTRLTALDEPCHAVNLLARESEPTLSVVAAGTVFDDPAVVLVTGPTKMAARFDVVAIDPGERMPFEAVVVRFTGV